MNGLSIEIDTQQLVQALLKNPALLGRNVSNAILRVTKSVARSAREYAPKAFSTLTQSIHDTQVSQYEGVVSAGVDYATAVERGTSRQPMPPVANILDWIRVRRIEPNQPDMDQEDLAFIVARSIAARGMPPQPYMGPALADNRRDAERRLNIAIDAALAGRAA